MLCPDRFGQASEKSFNCENRWKAKPITAAIGYDTTTAGRASRVVRGAVRHSVVDALTQEKPALATQTDQTDEREKHAEPE
jgi:hypothetical protein